MILRILVDGIFLLLFSLKYVVSSGVTVGSRCVFIYLCIWDTLCVLNLGANDLLTNEEKIIIWSNVASPLSLSFLGSWILQSFLPRL